MRQNGCIVFFFTFLLFLCFCMIQQEAIIHRSKFRNGPFKINLHPRDYFQSNPYRSDKPFSPAQKSLPLGKKESPVPFKPPSLGKKVNIPPSCEKLNADHILSLICDVYLTCLCVYVNASFLRLEEWKLGPLVLTPHILLIHMSSIGPNQTTKNQSSVLHLVLRVHLSRVSLPSMLTGCSLSVVSDLLYFSFLSDAHIVHWHLLDNIFAPTWWMSVHYFPSVYLSFCSPPSTEKNIWLTVKWSPSHRQQWKSNHMIGC